MATDRQIAANRRNAQKSTGPRTPEGKARSRFNGLKHGLAGRHLLIPVAQSRDFAAFREPLLDYLRPANAREIRLANQIVAGLWRAERCQFAQTGKFETAHTQLAYDQSYRSLTTTAQRLAHLYRQAHAGMAISFRYEVRHERSFYRALRDLIQLRKLGSRGTGAFDRADEDPNDPIQIDWVPRDQAPVLQLQA